MKNTIENLKYNWNKIPQLARMIIYAAGFAMVVLLLITMFAPSKYQTLYTGLETQDALDIQQYLSTRGVEYQLTEDGSGISIDGDVILIKRDLALQNLPQGGAAGGLSKFDELSIGSTKYDKEVQYQSRLQEDIQSSIVKAFENITNATVKLPRIEEESIFEENPEPLMVSVALKTRNNLEITPENVRAIQVFVAASLQEVNPDNVEVVDSKMNVLSGSDEESSFGSGSGKQTEIINQAKVQIEKELTQNLEAIYGKVRVIANVDINFDEIVQNIERYDPEGTILSREENSDQTREVNSNGNTTAGEVGTDQNGEVPRYEIEDLNEEDVMYLQDKENLIENFAVGKTVEKVIKHPELRNTNVAVWVDANLSQIEIEELEEMISISSGLTGQAMRDANQKAMYDNGSVKVTQREFVEIPEEELFEAEEVGFEMKWWYWLIIGVIVLLLVGLAVFTVLNSRKRKKELLAAIEEEQRLQAAALKKAPVAKAVDIELDEDYEPEQIQEKFKFEWTNKQTGLRESTNDVSKKFPKETADVIKKFLRDSEE